MKIGRKVRIEGELSEVSSLSFSKNERIEMRLVAKALFGNNMSEMLRFTYGFWKAHATLIPNVATGEKGIEALPPDQSSPKRSA